MLAQDGEELTDLVAQLKKQQVNKDALRETMLGRTVNALRKRCPHKDAAKQAKELLQTWEAAVGSPASRRDAKPPKRLIDEVAPR